MREYRNERAAQRKIARVNMLARKVALFQTQLDEVKADLFKTFDAWKAEGDTGCLSDAFRFYRAARDGKLGEEMEALWAE
jgi:hypothetical protein